MAEPRLVPLGIVTRPHGVRGELRVAPHNPDSTLLLELDAVVLRFANGETAMTGVTFARAVPGAVLLRLADVDDREGAEALRGAELCVPREALPELPAGEWYQVDLVDLAVVDPDGQALGRVERVVDYPAAQCLRVIAVDGVREVPMAAPYLVDVSLETRTATVAHWDDLAIEPAGKKG